jgi:SanA protein
MDAKKNLNKKSPKPKRRNVILTSLISVFCLCLTVFLASQVWIKQASAGKHSADIEKVPIGQVALVLGTSNKLANGRPNIYYTRRISAAVELWKAKKCANFIVSGDNGTRGYDEPTDMKNDLMARGVPEKNIYCDYAGFRTLDSMVRAKQVFGQSQVIVVSQGWHNERAIFFAEHFGLDAFGYDAPGPNELYFSNTREVFARVQAVLDITILQTKPKFLGEPVVIAKAVEEIPGTNKSL